MPLSKIQSEILVLLAAHRNPESYVAGAVPLNRDGPRYSADIDIFHDREESVNWNPKKMGVLTLPLEIWSCALWSRSGLAERRSPMSKCGTCPASGSRLTKSGPMSART